MCFASVNTNLLKKNHCVRFNTNSNFFFPKGIKQIARAIANNFNFLSCFIMFKESNRFLVSEMKLIYVITRICLFIYFFFNRTLFKPSSF